jgi:ABC-type lipoprotein release transport system permease subunit
MAQQFGSSTRAVGASLLIDSVPFTVVGVIADARDVGFREIRPAVYLPFHWNASPKVIVRGDVAGAQRLARAISERDPALTVSIKPYRQYVAEQFADRNFAASVSGALGVLALLLASVGMLGVFTYWVEQRQHDIGVRVALGATPRHIATLVLSASARAVMWGLVVGLIAAVGVAQLLRSSLYGLQPLDVPSFATATGILICSALVATFVPTRRAIRITPMSSLRAD